MFWGIAGILYFISKGYWWIVPLLIIGAIGKLFNAGVAAKERELEREDFTDYL